MIQAAGAQSGAKRSSSVESLRRTNVRRTIMPRTTLSGILPLSTVRKKTIPKLSLVTPGISMRSW